MADYTTDVLVKLNLGGVTDSARDDLIDAAITAASRAIDNYCGRSFEAASAATVRVYNPDKRIYSDGTFLVDDIGATDGIVVEWGDSTSGFTALTDYETVPENAIAKGVPITGILRTDPWTGSAKTRLRLTAKYGFPAVPDEVKQAALILACRLFKRKDSPEGVLGSSEWGTVRLANTDPDVVALISKYVLHPAV